MANYCFWRLSLRICHNILSAPSAVSNYLLRGAFFPFDVCWHLLFIFWLSLKLNLMLFFLGLFCCEDYILTYHSVEPQLNSAAEVRKHSYLLFLILSFSCSCSPKYLQHFSLYPEAADSLMNVDMVILYRRAQHISNIRKVRCQPLSSSVLFGTETTLSWFRGPFAPPSRLDVRRLTNKPNICWAVPAAAVVSLQGHTGRGWLGRRVLADLFTTCL